MMRSDMDAIRSLAANTKRCLNEDEAARVQGYARTIAQVVRQRRPKVKDLAHLGLRELFEELMQDPEAKDLMREMMGGDDA